MAVVRLSIDVKNLDRVRNELARLSGPEAKRAYAAAINDTAFKLQREVKAEIRRSFDRVTKYVANSPRVEPATAQKLSAAVRPARSSRGSADDRVDPQSVLQGQVFGGARADKRSERRLRQLGLLPVGFQTAIPLDPYPGSDDGKGNLRGLFLKKVLSQLTAEGPRPPPGLPRKGLKPSGKARRAAYFVHGDVPGHRLRPGIYARLGDQVRAVLFFVRGPSYSRRLDLDRLTRTSDAQEYLERRIRARIRKAAGV